MKKEQITYYAMLSLGIVMAGIILLVSLKYILPVLLPFLIAWLMASATRTPALILEKKTKVSAGVYRLMLSLFLTVGVFSAIAIVVWQLTLSLWRFLSDLGQENRINDFLNLLASPRLPILGEGISDDLAARISEAINGMLSSALVWLGDIVKNVMAAVPGVFFFLIVTLISLIYFSLDLERINSFCNRILPTNISAALGKFKDGVLFVIKKYIRSYLLIMLITYLTVLLGFFVLGVEHAPLIALVVALLDILPVIGVGTVLIPWGIVEIAMGEQFMGVGLLILFVVNTLVRQLSEPKIVGKNLDLHPVATLIFLYVGYRLFGFAGLILFPVVAITITVALKKDNSSQVG